MMTFHSETSRPALAQEIGDRLRDARVEARLTREAVGAHVGVGSAAVGAWERGEAMLPVDCAIRLAPLIGKPAAWLLRVDDPGAEHIGPYIVVPPPTVDIDAAAAAAAALGCELRVTERGGRRALLIQRSAAT